MSINIASITQNDIKNTKTTDLVNVYNQLNQNAQIKKFVDRKTAEARVWKIVQTEQEKLKTAIPATTQSEKMGKRGNYNQRIIKLLVTENPKKVNSRAFVKFGILMQHAGKTIQSYKDEEGKHPALDFEKGWAATELRWAINLGLVKV